MAKLTRKAPSPQGTRAFSATFMRGQFLRKIFFSLELCQACGKKLDRQAGSDELRRRLRRFFHRSRFCSCAPRSR